MTSEFKDHFYKVKDNLVNYIITNFHNDILTGCLVMSFCRNLMNFLLYVVKELATRVCFVKLLHSHSQVSWTTFLQANHQLLIPCTFLRDLIIKTFFFQQHIMKAYFFNQTLVYIIVANQIPTKIKMNENVCVRLVAIRNYIKDYT